MSDDRHTTRLDAAGVATLVGGRLEGDSQLEVRGIAPVDQAAPDQIGFLASRVYLPRAADSTAHLLLVQEDLAPEVEHFPSRVIVDDAHAALRSLLDHFHPTQPPTPEIHPTAVMGSGVRLGEEVSIGAYAVLGEDVAVGNRTHIGSHVSVGSGCQIGEECTLHPQVVLYSGSRLGDRVVLHSGVRVGTDGFGYVFEENEHRKVPQVGGCVLEDDVEVGANSCIDRGSIGDTVVGRGSKLDNLVQLGHNVQVGPHCILVAQVGIAGSTRMGPGVQFAGHSGAAGHLEIGAGAQIAAKSATFRSIAAGEVVMGTPARPRAKYLRAQAVFMKLPELVKRVRALEKSSDAAGSSDEDPPT